MKFLLTCLFILVPFIVEGSIVVDTFAVGPQTVTANSGNNNASQSLSGLDTAHVLDGQRRITVQGNMSVGSIVATVDTSNGGSFAYSSNNPAFTDAFGGRLLLTHIAGDRSNTFDLSQFASEFYIIDFESSFFGGSGSFAATLNVSSPSGSDSTSLTIDETGSPFQVSVPISELSGADLSQAYNLTLDISGLPSTAAFEISNISFSSSVPEPRAVTLLVLAILILATSSLFKSRRQAEHVTN
ncbi:hypothetical protein N8590_00420 [bacterium]|nr:hypothetical protein [bacterium]MDB4802669.1 hypothetical protein [bacterium]